MLCSRPTNTFVCLVYLQTVFIANCIVSSSSIDYSANDNDSWSRLSSSYLKVTLTKIVLKLFRTEVSLYSTRHCFFCCAITLHDSVLCVLVSLWNGKSVNIMLYAPNSTPHIHLYNIERNLRIVDNDDDNNSNTDNGYNLGRELRKCYWAYALEEIKLVLLR